MLWKHKNAIDKKKEDENRKRKFETWKKKLKKFYSRMRYLS